MMIIDNGRIIYNGSIAGIKERFTPYRVLVVDFADGVPEVKIARAELMEREGQRARFRFNREHVSASELITELAQQHRVRDISVEEPEIEEVVRKIYERSATDESLTI